MNLQQGGQSLAQAGDVGEMFRYQIASPVKLERSKSAMLPIVNESVSGDKVSIYNEGTHAKHPLNGLRLKNTTDLHLMQALYGNLLHLALDRMSAVASEPIGLHTNDKMCAQLLS